MYIGVDLGTSGLKALLCDEKGKILDSASMQYKIEYLGNGLVEQNPNDWYDALVDCIVKLGVKHDLKAVQAISFCGQMHGMVVLDKNNSVYYPAILWNDNRAIKQSEYINNYFGHKMLDMIGNIVYPGFVLPKILWLKENYYNEFLKIDKLMLPKDYLLYRVSGCFASDNSDNSGTGYFDVKNKKWCQPILDFVGIRQSQLPRIYESYDCIGTITQEFASRVGLSNTTKVIAGGGDQSVGAIGTGTVGAGSLSISLGTSGVVFGSLDRYVDNTCVGLHNFCHADGKYHLMGCALSCAASVDFFIKQLLNTSDYQVEFDKAKHAQADNLIFLPYLNGERSPINDPIAKGVIYGINLNTTRADIVRAVVEGVCFSLKDCYVEMQKAGIKASYATVIGGLAKNQWITQTLASCLDLPLKTLSTVEGGAYGAVMLAMVGSGLYTMREAINNLVSYDSTIMPIKQQTESVKSKWIKYKELYSRLKNLG